MTRLAAANAGRNYSATKVGWSGRFDSSWAYALWHERGHPVSSTLVAAAIPANAGRTTGRAARQALARCVGCSNHPATPQGKRSSDNCPAIFVAGDYGANARRMPVGLQDRAACRPSGKQVGCSIHPAFWNKTRNSVHRPANARRRDDKRPRANAAGDYRGRIAP